MQKTKILVLGGSGQVGSELRHKLACQGQIIAVNYPALDLSKPDSIREVVRNTQPAVLVNAAAYTAVDKAETDIERASAINGIAPGILAEESKQLGSLLIHYSTDYVFDGSKQLPYIETDIPNPLNVYGKTKLAGDQAIESVGGDYLIFRTSWVYGARGHNFLLTMLRLAKERSELRIVDDQVGAPTTSECIAQATANVLAQVLSPGSHGLDGRSGIYNLTCGGRTSWFGFAKAGLTRSVSRLGGTVPNLVPILSREYPQAARRPANSCLSGQRLEDTFGQRLPDWEQALELILETLEESPHHELRVR